MSKHSKEIVDRITAIMLTTLAMMVIFVLTFNGQEHEPLAVMFVVILCSALILISGSMWTMSYMASKVRDVLQEEYEVTDD